MLVKWKLLLKMKKSIIITKNQIPDRYNSDIDVKVENEISKSTDKIESINLLDYFNLPYENEINLADKKDISIMNIMKISIKLLKNYKWRNRSRSNREKTWIRRNKN